MSLLRRAFLMAGSDINGIDISDLSVKIEKNYCCRSSTPDRHA
jgi:hypothetical protein